MGQPLANGVTFCYFYLKSDYQLVINQVASLIFGNYPFDSALVLFSDYF